ncbi:double-stranded RNA-binding protein 3 [Striga asiatica]|uniref:Double-stranded RNA-binding protein 3 n=1 Tax=Striga asiatica TaxID=4170 RepID=A0A5A7PV77_STRAF|nr:double-stranded RNA-binding protein 3 [Striga asiatica]
MEAGEIAFDSEGELLVGASYTLANLASHLSKDEPLDGPGFEGVQESPAKKRKIETSNHNALEKDETPGVTNCYIFKSRLQEFCQKAGLTTPVYETIKEGPSHEPFFRSTVIVNNERYDSLPGFFNRKAAEQSAAEVALVELANSADMKFWISQPVTLKKRRYDIKFKFTTFNFYILNETTFHFILQETGLCKNVLQEYAQKMNYAIPLYECHKVEKLGRASAYSCVVEIGGIKYIGALASTKKEAEIKAARTAMIAIQSSVSNSENGTSNSLYTVFPQKKKSTDNNKTCNSTKDNAKVGPSKKKKGGFKKKKAFKKRKPVEGEMLSEVEMNGGDGLGLEEVKMGNTCGSGDC